MTNIYILSEDLVRVGVVNQYSALTWSLRWSSGGSFCLWAPLTEENADLLQTGRLVWIETDNLCVIEAIESSLDEDGNPSIKVSGRSIEAAWLSKRIIWGTVRTQGYASYVLRHLVRTQVVSPQDSKRRINHITVPAGQSLGSMIAYCNSYGNLWQQQEELSIANNVDVRLMYRPTQGALEYTVRSGADRSSTVKLTSDLGILFGSEYYRDVSNFCNTALIAGEGEESDRVVAYIGDSNSGLSRNELYVDARDLQSEYDQITQEYMEELLNRGEQKLTEYAASEEYSTKLQLGSSESYRYGRDFSFGDRISLVDTQLMISMQATVSGYELTRDADGESISITLGVSPASITKIIRRRDK